MDGEQHGPPPGEADELRALARLLRGGGATGEPAGESLRALLERRGTLPPRHALEIARSILLRLEDLHRRGEVHGALELMSVRLAPRVPWSERNPFGVGVLPLAPAAPEAGATAALDVLAVALLLAELLVGTRLAPEGGDWGSARAAVAGRDVRALLDRALGPDRSRRFATAAAFRAALERTPTWRGVTPALRAARLTAAVLFLGALVLAGLLWRERAVVRAAHERAAEARACAALDRLLECVEEGDLAAAAALLASTRADEGLAALGFDSGFLEAVLETSDALAGAAGEDDPAERGLFLDAARASAGRARESGEAFRVQASAWLDLDLPPRPARGRDVLAWFESLQRDLDQRTAALGSTSAGDD